MCRFLEVQVILELRILTTLITSALRTSEFEASLVYSVNFKPAKVTEEDPVSKNMREFQNRIRFGAKIIWSRSLLWVIYLFWEWSFFPTTWALTTELSSSDLEG